MARTPKVSVDTDRLEAKIEQLTSIIEDLLQEIRNRDIDMLMACERDILDETFGDYSNE